MIMGTLVRIGLFATIALGLVTQPVFGADSMRRFVLAAGANLGGQSRIPLQCHLPTYTLLSQDLSFLLLYRST